MIAHIYPSVLQAVAGRGYAWRLEGGIPGYRGGAIQDLGYEFPREHIPRTPVNKGYNRRRRSEACGMPCSSANKEAL
jgi:hypothetical protein